jgi:histidinol-phosphatase (PHP family)
LIDYHVHLWPHAERADESELALERLAAYTEQAASNGVGEIALTEHFFRFTKARAVVEGWWDRLETGGEPTDHVVRYFDHHATAEIDRYVETVELAKSAGLPVVAGLEVDYYPGQMDEVARFLADYPFDVLLGSVHWIGLWLFDVLEDAYAQRRWESASIDQVWLSYTEAIEELAATGACDVLAHPDLVKIGRRYPGQSLLDECEARIAEAAARSGVAAEISAAGRRKAGEDYPSPQLLRRFFEAGVPVTFASDAHGPALVGERNGELVAAARRAGYSSVMTFRAREGSELPLGQPEAEP